MLGNPAKRFFSPNNIRIYPTLPVFNSFSKNENT